MAIALALGLIFCNLLLKPLINRPRPFKVQADMGVIINLLIKEPGPHSFPSGHTIASFEAATALALHNKKLGIPALILAGLIAFSRLYLYVHYPTDVIASVILGVGFAFFSTWLAKKIAGKVNFIQ
jgi:undecaprenyl-diphosphatase